MFILTKRYSAKDNFAPPTIKLKEQIPMGNVLKQVYLFYMGLDSYFWVEFTLTPQWETYISNF